MNEEGSVGSLDKILGHWSPNLVRGKLKSMTIGMLSEQLPKN